MIEHKDTGVVGTLSPQMKKNPCIFSNALSNHRKFGEVLFVVEKLVSTGGEMA